MLFTTAIGLDFVFRGTERMGLVAISLCVRTGILCAGRIGLCPRCQVESSGWPIWLTWRVERDHLGLVQVFEGNIGFHVRGLLYAFFSSWCQRGRTVCLMALSQAVINMRTS